MLNNSSLRRSEIQEYYVPFAASVYIIILFSTFMLNFYIILNISINKKLHTPINMFVMSLSFYGIIASSTCMPFQFSYVLNNFKWIFSADMCMIWYIVDFSVSTGILFNLTMIMFIRYMAIVKPHVQWTTKRIQYSILFFVSFVPFLSWTITILYSFPQNFVEDVCYFAIDKKFLVTTDVISFVIPFLILTIINAKLMLELRKRSKKVTFSEDRIFQISQESCQSSKRYFK